MDGVWLLVAGVILLIFFLLILVVGLGLILYVRKKRKAAAMAAGAVAQPAPDFATAPLSGGADQYGSPQYAAPSPMTFTPDPMQAHSPIAPEPPQFSPQPFTPEPAPSYAPPAPYSPEPPPSFAPPSFAPEPPSAFHPPQQFSPEPFAPPVSFSEPIAHPAVHQPPAAPPPSFHPEPPIAPPPPPYQPPSAAPVFEQPAPPVFEPPQPHVPAPHVPVRQGWGSLVGTSGPVTGRTIPVDEKGFYIGRDRATAQVVIENARISKRHVWIGIKGNAVVAIDQSSTNGTYLNKIGNRITEVTLQPGDTLILADDAARFQYQA